MKFTRSLICFFAVFAMVTLGMSGDFSNRLFAISQTQPVAQTSESLPETESLQGELGFLIEQYPIHHQGANKLNITLSCTLKASYGDSNFIDHAINNPDNPDNLDQVAAPDSLMVYHQITDFLRSYPNEKDYWEIVNRNLTEAILAKNSMVASVTATLEVLPTQQAPYTRSTTVTHSDNGTMLESWSFITGQVTVQRQGEHKLNLRVKYRYRDGLSGADYPNFIPIYARIEQFLSAYGRPTDSWETVNRNLVNTVLQEYPVMDSFTSKLEVNPTPDLPYHFFTTITRLQPDS
jgi:hypothetical protein